jgi:hypothetical protein
MSLSAEYFSEIKSENKTYALANPIEVMVGWDEEWDRWECRSKEFAIIAFGDTKQDSIRVFRDYFDDAVQDIALEKDENLSPAAIRVKKNILAVVKNI